MITSTGSPIEPLPEDVVSAIRRGLKHQRFIVRAEGMVFLTDTPRDGDEILHDDEAE